MHGLKNNGECFRPPEQFCQAVGHEAVADDQAQGQRCPVAKPAWVGEAGGKADKVPDRILCGWGGFHEYFVIFQLE